MEELKKDDLLSEIKQLQEKIDGDPTAQMMLSLLETSKALDRQESELQSRCILEHAKLQTKVDEFEELLQRGKERKFSENLDHTFRESIEKLDSAKRELAAKLRSTLSFKRQLDDVPSQDELIQYELRFSELYTHIQFKDALSSPAGRKKLIDSMEGILQGTQQKQISAFQICLCEHYLVVNNIKRSKHCPVEFIWSVTWTLTSELHIPEVGKGANCSTVGAESS